jgi:TRAP-type C4-dicarboxylate transport system permease small subunit
MMMLTVTDVFLRYFFNAPISGTTEITEFMLVIVVFPALAWCAVTGKHVKVDLLMTHFPPRVQAIVDSITLLLVFGIFVIITWQSFLESKVVDSSTSLLGLPSAPFYWAMTVGLVLFCLAIATLVIENIAKGVKR